MRDKNAKINALDVKREITQKRPRADERKALLSGFCRVCFSLVRHGGGGTDLSLDCQSDEVRDYIASLMLEEFMVAPINGYTTLPHGEVERRSELVYADAQKLLTGLYIQKKEDDFFDLYGIADRFYKNAGSYARGVFLGCGSLSVPKADKAGSRKSGGYHLEFSFTTEQLANDFLALLSGYGVYANLTFRAGKYIVYVKDKDNVSDCLAIVGADKSVLMLNEAVVAFAVKSEVNRRLNCEMANMNRTVSAAVDVAKAIDIIEKLSPSALDSKLAAAAEARKRDPEAPIGKIAEELGISKSGLKHRFDRIIEIAQSLSARDNESLE